MLYVIQTALELGFMYALVAMALFLSYRVLDIADLTTDSGFVLGAAVSVTAAAAGDTGGHGCRRRRRICYGISPDEAWSSLHSGRDRNQYGTLHSEPYGHGLELQCESFKTGDTFYHAAGYGHRRELV